MKVILAILALLTGCATAQPAPRMVAYGDKDSVVILSTGKCENADVLESIKPEHHAKFKAGEASMHGSTVAICWAAIGAVVHIAFEEGTHIMIPVSRFELYDPAAPKRGGV